ncbi:MAG: hypothetical protein WDO71_12485 [Bacteroidota bacterium]
MILCFLFLALWVAGLFYPNRTMSIHIALIVELGFLVYSLMSKKSATGKSAESASHQ